MERFEQVNFNPPDSDNVGEMTTRQEVVNCVESNIREDYNRCFGVEYKAYTLRIKETEEKLKELKQKRSEMKYKPPVFGE